MASSYPTGLDTLTKPTANTPIAGHGQLHSDSSSAIEALEAKVGVDSSAVTTSIDYLLKSTSSSNPGHKHTLANGATDVTSTASELNVLDGITATTTELNYTDGVTSAIQTQLDAKVPTTRTVNGHALSGNVTVTASDVGLGNVDNTSDSTKNSASVTLTNKTIDIESNTITTISCSVYCSANLTSFASDTVITWDSENFDVGSLHSTVSNTSRLTVPSAGKYLINVNIQFGSTEDKYFWLKKNGSNFLLGSRSTGTNQVGSFLVNASANDYFEIAPGVNGGTAFTVEGGVTQSTFSIVKVSD